MTTAPAIISFAPDAEFRFVGGDPSLDFVNTVDWTRRGLVAERLIDYDRVLDWAEQAGVLDTSRLDGLRARAARSERDAREALGAARHCRWVLRRVFEAVAGGAAGAGAGEALADLNILLRAAHAQLALRREPGAPARPGVPLAWEWRDADERLDAVLWPVVRAAAMLLVSDEAAQVRVCGGEDCGWTYVDRSRNGLRRWCEMSVCGTRAKARRRAVKRSAGR